MKSRILSNSYVIDFANVGFDLEKIDSTIKIETDKIIKPIENEKLKDWEIQFSFWYNNVKQILISKSRLGTYSKEKRKAVTVHIPIPIKSIVAWGVDLGQHAYQDENHLDHLMKNFICLDVDFSRFENRTDYILDCMRRAIKLYFIEGVSINKVKLRITD
jgi:hypothetical protein